MQKVVKNKSKQELSGFTIIEFTLATAFISGLLISIAVVASMVIQIYQKGLTLKSINSVGRGLTDEIVGAINAAPSVDTTNLCDNYLTGNSLIKDSCKKDNAYKFIYQEYTAADEDDSDGTDQTQLGGVFCTGNYSYIWNTYYGLHGKYAFGGKMKLIYLPVGAEETKTLSNIKLAQVKDPTYRMCSTNIGSSYGRSYSEDYSGSILVDISTLANEVPNPIQEPTSGYLESSEVGLQLYEFTVFPISQDQVTLRTFMSGTFILGTERGNINIERSGDYCDVEAASGDGTTALLDIGSEFTYCGINKFNFAARTAGM